MRVNLTVKQIVSTCVQVPCAFTRLVCENVFVMLSIRLAKKCYELGPKIKTLSITIAQQVIGYGINAAQRLISYHKSQRFDRWAR